MDLNRSCIGQKVVYWEGENKRIYEITNFDRWGWVMLFTDIRETRTGRLEMEKPPYLNIRFATPKEIKLGVRRNYI